jgi:hypothetical protein
MFCCLEQFISMQEAGDYHSDRIGIWDEYWVPVARRSAIVAAIAFKSRQYPEIDFSPVEILYCVCPPCIDQNIKAYSN